MRFWTAIAMAAAFHLAAPPAFAQSEISAEEQAALDTALSLGQAIYLYDQAAWHTTDRMIEDLDDRQKPEVRGWVVNQHEPGLEVVYYRQAAGNDGFEAVWSGVFSEGEVSQSRIYQPGERPLVSSEEAQVEALYAAVEMPMGFCSEQRPNFVILPTGKPDAGLYVYFLTPQPTIEEIPFGGHHRHEVVDGKVVASRKFTNSCLTLSTKSQDEKTELAAMAVSHILDPTPTEIHVFSMYAAKMPIVVITSGNDKTWQISSPGGEPQIELLER